jgi:hypothetical protein
MRPGCARGWRRLPPASARKSSWRAWCRNG